MPYISIPGRNYYYAKYAAPNPQAIIIGYHGFAGSGPVFAGQSKFHLRNVPAVVVYPSGYFLVWDVGNSTPDVAMTNALIAKLRTDYGPLPVYVSGISMGASMAYRAATSCDVEKLGAVAAGLNPVVANRAPQTAIHIHGDSDTIVPFATYQPSIQAGMDLLSSMGTAVDLRMIAGGIHDWNPVPTFDSTGEILTAWGLPHV